MAADRTPVPSPLPSFSPRLASSLSAKAGLLISIEGVWGAGKTAIAAMLRQRLDDHGFRTHVARYGPRDGIIGRLSELLDDRPLRRRTGTGGFAQPHHATVDALLRLCREAHNHTRVYQPTVEAHDVVIVDHGMYSKLAYCMTVLREQHQADDPTELFARLRACVAPWFLIPDLAFHLDVPWPLARERAIARGHGGGMPASVERLLFLPAYDAACRQIVKAMPDQVVRIVVGLRGTDDVVDEIERWSLRMLRVPSPPGGRDE